MSTGAAGLEWQVGEAYYSAATFRILIDSLARPGKINQLTLPANLLEVVPEFATMRYSLSALLTLLDSSVTFAIAREGEWLPANSSLAKWLSLQSNARLEQPERANFALFCDEASHPLMSQLNLGDSLLPEESTTVFYHVSKLQNLETSPAPLAPTGISLELRGPGIATSQQIYVEGLSQAAIKTVKATRNNYPTGLDLFLVDPTGQCVGLPRTTRLKLVL